MKLANDVMIRPDRFRDVKVKNIVGEFARGENPTNMTISHTYK